MADTTRYLASRQMLSMGRISLFEVGLLRPETEQMFIRTFSFEQVLTSVGWMRANNAKGAHIYIRPSGAHSLCMIDDLTSDALLLMKQDGFAPACIVETSPGNYQAWLNHGVVLEPAISTIASRLLSSRFGGDPHSADWRHFGRLAGFTNRKIAYRMPNGMFPFVKLVESCGNTYANAQSIINTAFELHSKEQKELSDRRNSFLLSPSVSNSHNKTIVEFRSNAKYGGDMTRADLAYAIYAVSNGEDLNEIRGSLASRDLSHKGTQKRQDDYVERTLDKALLIAGRRN